MPIYTTKSNVIAELPSGRGIDPSTGSAYSVDDWNTKLDEIIAQKSQEVDDKVGGNYPFSYATNTQKFPDITDSPATPATIEKIARYLAFVDAVSYYKGLWSSADSQVRLRRRNWAEENLTMIQEGKTPISVNGVYLNTVVFTSENDRADDQQDEMIFNRDDLDEMLP